MKWISTVCNLLVLIVISWVMCVLVTALIGAKLDDVFILSYLFLSILVWVSIRFAMYVVRESEDDYLDKA